MIPRSAVGSDCVRHYESPGSTPSLECPVVQQYRGFPKHDVLRYKPMGRGTCRGDGFRLLVYSDESSLFTAKSTTNAWGRNAI